MTPEQQRIAIAEACGWSHHTIDGHTYWWHEENNKTLPPDDDGMRSCPDYFNDLNACNTLIDHLQTLGYDCVIVAEGPHRACTFICQSTKVEQKAISFRLTTSICLAFLRTLNLWKS